MKVSWNWLLDYVTPPEGPEEVAARLTLAGLEVEGIERLGDQFSGVVVAEVVDRRPHPNAQKLTLVTVADGAGKHEVVCGAGNVPAPGGKVLWARPGAKLPGGVEIGSKELKGVRSAGMICSAKELGLAAEGEGIIVLGGDEATAAPGSAAQDALGLRDVVLDVNIHANRSDCLGHLGIAREIAALYGVPLRRPDASLDPVLGDLDVATLVTVSIEDPAACPRFTARVVDGLKLGPAPRWMRRRLEAVGVRPISNLVDVTNYVMFELGHPLHAFDYDRVERGAIIVRRAKAGERMTTLDGQERQLVAPGPGAGGGADEPGDILVCDPRGPVGLAGVMGGGGSEVAGATTRILLEAASFDPRSIRRTAKRLGLHSEASHRFERGVDANGVDFASARAARLLAETGGGRVARGLVDQHPRPATPMTLELRPARVAAVLGTTVTPIDISRYLKTLELTVDPAEPDERWLDPEATLRVTVPTFRRDLEREVDLIEEVARLHGLDKIPATLPVSQAAPTSPRDRLGDLSRAALTAAGLDEAITFGFTAPARLAALRFPDGHPAARPIGVKNPMRPEQAVMRTSLLANLLPALAHNLSFGVSDVRLFEIGSVFFPRAEPAAAPSETPVIERRFCAGVLSGNRPGWLEDAGPLDFWDVKGAVERLFQALRIPVDFAPLRNPNGFLHPGVAATVMVAGPPVGSGRGVHVGAVGEVHPETRDRLGLSRPCFAFELDLDNLPPLTPAQLGPIPRYPAVGRDVSFFVDEDVPAARIRDAILADRPPLLGEVNVLEDYREPGRVPPGKKGMLWSLTYRSAERTLTDAEVDAMHEALVARLLAALRAERR